MLRNYYSKLLPLATVMLLGGGLAKANPVMIEITGEVPVICRATLDDFTNQSGTLREFCNAARGYDLYVEASAELTGASVSVDGNEIPLAGSAPTLISSSDSPQNRVRSLVLNTGDDTSGRLSLRIVPRT